MFGAAGGALAASVTLAGGFGFIGAGYSFYKNISAELDIAEQKLSISGMNERRRREEGCREEMVGVDWCLSSALDTTIETIIAGMNEG